MWRSLLVLLLLASPAMGDDCGTLFGLSFDSDGDGCCNDVDYDPYDPGVCVECDYYGGDQDGDGTCAANDYDDNDPSVQNAPPCASEGGDADGDGVCANADYDDNDPAVQGPPAPGAGAGLLADFLINGIVPGSLGESAMDSVGAMLTVACAAVAGLAALWLVVRFLRRMIRRAA